MRIFTAIDVDDAIRSRIARFLEGVRPFAPEARWARPESLHVTLKFIGEQSEEQIDEIKRTLAAIEADSFEMTVSGYGFFPTARAPRVFWIGIDGSAMLASLAANVDFKLASLDIPKEEHAYNPHLTLARSAGRSGSPRREKEDRSHRKFQNLQEKLAALAAPGFGTMTVREFFLYQSKLSPGGSKYTKLEGFKLR